MKKRPANTVSERQLVWALQQSGRHAGLKDLVAWRKIGLLPALASHGIGAGRAYYWREADILKQAEAVYDALDRLGRPDGALIAVWLAGFTVPLIRLRRAWLGRSRMRRAVAASAPVLKGWPRPSSGAAAGLLEQAFGAVAALTATEADRGHAALETVDYRQNFRTPGELKRQLTALALVYGPLLENSDLVRTAGDEEFIEARRYLRKISDRDERLSRDSDSLDFLFLFFLTLVHSGQRQLLEAVDLMEEPDLRPAPSGSDQLRIAS